MITTYYKNLLTDRIWNLGSATLPITFFLGLSNAMPSANGSGFTEPSSSTGYARIQLTGLTRDANGNATNSTVLAFPESLGSQGYVSVYGVFDRQTGGNLLIAEKLESSSLIDIDTTATIKPGVLKLSVVGVV